MVLGDGLNLIIQKHDNLSICVGFDKSKDYIVSDILERKLPHRYHSFMP